MEKADCRTYEWSAIKVAVTQYELKDLEHEPKPFIDYTIRITKNGVSWEISKRYNQLVRLHNWILTNPQFAINFDLLPPFPEAPIFDLKQVEKVAEERKGTIENYLEYIINLSEVYETIQGKVWFELGNVVPVQLRRKVLIPLPDHDFDLTQVSVVWKTLTSLGIIVHFATELGNVASCKSTQLSKGSVVPGTFMKPSAESKRYYNAMIQSTFYRNPVTWSQIKPTNYSGVVVTGGMAPGLSQILESEDIREKMREFWTLGRPCGAIGQGVLVFARVTMPDSGISVLVNKRTTTLPAYLEKAGYYASFLKGGHSHLYEKYCEDEVIAATKAPLSLFERGPYSITGDYIFNSLPSFTVKDGFYLSARWEGDAFTFGQEFAKMLLNSRGFVENVNESFSHGEDVL